MSSIAAFYLRDLERDTVFIATDTLAVRKQDTTINGIRYPEYMHSFGSKILNFPHLKTSIASLGTQYLAMKAHEFVFMLRGVQDVDELIYAFESQFVGAMLNDASTLSFTLDDNTPDFIGMLFVSGLSYKHVAPSVPAVIRRPRPVIMSTKLMVYKDRVVNAGFMNTHKDTYGDNFIYCMHPRIDESVQEAIFNQFLPAKGKGYSDDSIYPAMLTEMFKEAHRKYHESGRDSIVSGGEVIITVMDNPRSGNFMSAQYVAHRFPDFDDNLNEIVSMIREEKQQTNK